MAIQKSRKSAGKRRSPGRAARRKSAAAWSGLFPGLKKSSSRFGVGVFIAVAEAWGNGPQVRAVRRESFSAQPGNRPRERLLAGVTERNLARMLGGFAHPERIRIARAILTGSSTHHDLSKALTLRPGPLYHHLRALERAGCLEIAERNRYVLTSRGMDILLVLTAATTFGQRRKSSTG
jgi:DNA-binding HxlR family transcriptional regulator